MNNRCRNDISKGFMGILRSDDHPRARCRLNEGHKGKHHAWYQPFAGFADEHLRWEDVSYPQSTTEEET